MNLKAGCGLAACVVALTGCGGSESGDADDAARQGAPPRLSKAEARYVERLDAICRESDENSGRVGAEIDRLESRRLPRAEMSQRVVEVLDESYVKSDEITKRIRRLEAPPGEKRFQRRYLAYTDRVDALNKRFRDAVARGAGVRGGELGPLRQKTSLVIKQRASLLRDHGGFRYCG